MRLDQGLHFGLLSLGLVSTGFLRIANRAPAMACGDSRPETLPSRARGAGSKLLLRPVAMELAGRCGVTLG